MKRFALVSLGFAFMAGACSDNNPQLLAPTSDASEARLSIERQGDVMKKSASASPMAISVQELDPPTLTPEDLAAALVGAGVTVSNVSYTGVNQAAGTFSGGNGIIGFESGIILSSGCISNVIGPNTSSSITCVNNTPGDPDLDGITTGTTLDAAVLEFDFVPISDRVFFQYVFSSDEYNSFVGTSFNDAFGFFINGVNYAVVGDPPVPITINTINRGRPGVEPTNPDLFRTNDPFTATFFGELCPAGGCFDTEMDGVTVVLTFEAPVNPGVTNRMKLAIADVGDRSWDSNVFIQAGTLAVCPNPVPLNEVWSTGTSDGTISLSSQNVFVSIYDVEQYLGRSAQATQVRMGPSFDEGTPAQSFTITDRNMDGNRDVVVTWSTSQLISDGHLSLDTEQIVVWGRDPNTSEQFCGVREVNVVP